MNENSWKEILSARADHPRRDPKTYAASHLESSGRERDELAQLSTLAEILKQVLVPVKPSDVFRRRLRAGLQLAGHHQSARRVLIPFRAPNLNYWWVGAAALGASVAAGGIIAWLVRSRTAHSHAG